MAKVIQKNQITTENLLTTLQQMITEGKSYEECGNYLHLLVKSARDEGFAKGFSEGFTQKDTLPF